MSWLFLLMRAYLLSGVADATSYFCPQIIQP